MTLTGQQIDAPRHPNLAAALVAALADIVVVKAERTAKIPGKDGKQGYSYDYADIGDVVRLTRPALAEHGVVALTPVHDHGNGLACTVTFLHVSGERLDLGPFPFPHGRDAQATGSMVTYHRRYALVAALGIAAGEDDDGASASAHREPERIALPTDLMARLDALPPEAQERLSAWASRAGEQNIRSVPAAWVDAVERAVAAEEAKNVTASNDPKVLEERAKALGEKKRPPTLPIDEKSKAAGEGE